ncbi:hypothetical protein FRACYDRAFT_233771 [Fragilariopsis cylindrus CCMP1102]|uniref:Uncharacterized protein n=1 Tax=Fragilariopsis cylindrus CCMP1102 TaxID=635003 RepID=A0A1E7FZL3_9STRA|nr:hypothetical protein FRACYDRAFT_233771 [Fragilariopsis cylindrus CCMP1102]|eukprot:OEU23599.1 hypothetical protein FRACYDRAFT_233771 [Fragilariopsis cylindrus CCMP1102]
MASSNNPTNALLIMTATIDSACTDNTAPAPAPAPASLISYYELILEELRQAAAVADVDVDVDDTSGSRLIKFQQILVNYENSTTTKKKIKRKSSTVVGVGVGEKMMNKSLVEKNKEGVDFVVVNTVVLEVVAADDVAETETETETEIDFFEFQPSYLTDVLVAQILIETNPVLYLPTIATSVAQLVGVNAVDIVNDDNNPKNTNNTNNGIITYESLSMELLQLWMALITNPVCPVSSVHEKLSNTLLILFQRRRRRQRQEHQQQYWEQLLTKMMDFLVNDNWKKYSSMNSNTSSSIASIRCATFMIRCISHLDNNDEAGDKSSFVLTHILKSKKSNDGNGGNDNNGVDLLVQMLNDFTDPLQQLSLLDCLIEEFDKSCDTDINIDDVVANNDDNKKKKKKNSTNVMNWLSSPEMMSPILQYLQDPLLCDGALRYTGMLSSMKSNEITIVFDHIKSLGKVPTNEMERLPIIRALSQAATITTSSSDESEDNNTSTAPLDIILNDAILRRCWWDISRVSQSKLQAAVLISIALTLPKISNAITTSSPSKVIQLYQLIGSDNTNDRSTTLEWLFTKKFMKSSIIEIRIASYTLLASIFRYVPITCIVMELNNTNNSNNITKDQDHDHANNSKKELILELLLNDDRDRTFNSQKAKYDVLESFMANTILMEDVVTDKKILKQLYDKLLLGPHGRKSQRYEDIMIA